MSPNTVQQAFFIGLVLVVTAAFVFLLAGYFQPIFWAATLGIIFLPVQRFIERRLHDRRTIAALLTLLTIANRAINPWINPRKGDQEHD